MSNTNTNTISMEDFEIFYNKSTNGANRKYTYDGNKTYFQLYLSNCEYIRADYDSTNQLIGLYYENELYLKHHNLINLNLNIKQLKSWIKNNIQY